MPDIKTAAPTGIGSGRISSNSGAIVEHRQAARKWQRVLRAILEGPKTTRDLERAPVFDHVAHSTAAELRKMGIRLVTEIVEIPGRGHSLIIDSGWRDVADAALAFLDRQGLRP